MSDQPEKLFGGERFASSAGIFWCGVCVCMYCVHYCDFFWSAYIMHSRVAGVVGMGYRGSMWYVVAKVGRENVRWTPSPCLSYSVSHFFAAETRSAVCFLNDELSLLAQVVAEWGRLDICLVFWMALLLLYGICARRHT